VEIRPEQTSLAAVLKTCQHRVVEQVDQNCFPPAQPTKAPKYNDVLLGANEEGPAAQFEVYSPEVQDNVLVLGLEVYQTD